MRAKNKADQGKEPTPFDRFKSALKKILQVPKEEVDEMARVEAEKKRQRKKG